ncbi:hypothetical protein KP509_15G027300 [Ceratopteris richardii]|uniref:NAD(P)-binding domain-containing protein n=1 Tax=Ceratopteris richardii TaxID=49495 RepID=A0A8T2T2Y8_CERRI|nr:hypothetical protein KP509_15G027300 [Ceratopteris richardii]
MGKLVYEKLKQNLDTFVIRGLLRSEERKHRTGGGEDVFASDITKAKTLSQTFLGVDVLIILTSKSGRRIFFYNEGAYLEQVDWIGQKNQIDATKIIGVRHIILVGSMGGRDPKHHLKPFANGRILIWKRHSELYLVDSGITYTLIKLGGLLDKEGGLRELLIANNDELLPTQMKTIPRADVAQVSVQEIPHDEVKNKAYDLASKPEGEGSSTLDFKSFFSQVF